MTILKQIITNILTAISMLLVAGSLLFSGVIYTNAQFSTTSLPGGTAICGEGNARGRLIGCQETDLAGLAGSIAGVMTFIIVSIAIIFIVYGTFIWMTDLKEGSKRGRAIITNSILALIISVVAYGVVASIIGFLSTTTITGGSSGR